MMRSLDEMSQRLQEAFGNSSSGTVDPVEAFYNFYAPGQAPAELEDPWEITTAAKRGVKVTAESLKVFPGIVGDALGFDEFAQEKYQNYRTAMEEIERDYAPAVGSIEDIEDLSSFVKWAMSITGENAPFLVGALVSGGAGSVAGWIANTAARKGIQGIAKESVKRAAEAAVKKSVGRYALGGVASFGGVMGAGEVAGEAIQEDLEVNPLLTLGSGAIIGALEALPISTLMRNFNLLGGFQSEVMGRIAAAPRGQRALLMAGVVSGQEAGTEVLQAIVEDAARQVVDDNYEFLGEEGKSRVINALAAGGFVGATFGGLGGALSRQKSPPKSTLEDLGQELQRTQEPPSLESQALEERAAFMEDEFNEIFRPSKRIDVRQPETLVEQFGIPGMTIEDAIKTDLEESQNLLEDVKLLPAPEKVSAFGRINYNRGGNEVIIIGERAELPNPMDGLRAHLEESASRTPADMELLYTFKAEDSKKREANVKAIRELARRVKQREIDEAEARAKAIVIIERDRKSAPKKAAKLTAQERGFTVRKKPTAQAIEENLKGTTRDVVRGRPVVAGQVAATPTPAVEPAIENDPLSANERARLNRLMEKESTSGLSQREWDIVERLLAKEANELDASTITESTSIEDLFRDEEGNWLRQAFNEVNSRGQEESRPKGGEVFRQEVWREIEGMVNRHSQLYEAEETNSRFGVVVYSPSKGLAEAREYSSLMTRGSEPSAINYSANPKGLADWLNFNDMADKLTASQMVKGLAKYGPSGAGLVMRTARNVVFINAERIKSRDHLRKTLLHEMVVHSGLGRLFSPAELTQVLTYMARIFDFSMVADHYGLDIGDFHNHRDFSRLTQTQQTNVRIVVEEGLARLAESDPQLKLWDRVKVYIMQAIRRIFPKLKLSDAELRYIVEQTAIALREPVFGENRYRGLVYPYIKTLSTETVDFKRRFSGSKMVQSDGKPMLFYHGTNMQMAAELHGEKYLYQPYEELKPSPTHGVLSMNESPNIAESWAEGMDAIRNGFGVGKFIYPIYVNSKSPMDYRNPSHVDRFLDALEKKRPLDMGSKEFYRQKIVNGMYDVLEDPQTLREAGFDGVWTEEGGNRNFHVLDSNQVIFALEVKPGAEHLSPRQQVIHTMAEGPAANASDVLLRVDTIRDAFGRELSEAGTQVVANTMSLQQLWKLKAMTMFMTPLQIAKKVSIKTIRDYVEEVERWWNTRIRIISNASELVEKKWRKLGKDQSQRLARALFEISEESDNLGRRLSDAEMAARFGRLGLSQEAIELYHELSNSMTEVLNNLEIGLKMNVVWELASGDKDAVVAAWENAYNDGKEAAIQFYDTTQDGHAMAARIREIESEYRDLHNRNYFPRSRFGRYSVSGIALEDMEIDGRQVKRGKLGVFATYESEKEQKAALADLQREYSGLSWKVGYLQDKEFSFLGLPPSLFESIDTKLSLTPGQKASLKEIWLAYGPGKGFSRHLTRRRGIAGYSQDAMRTYASYMMNAAGHLARVEHHVKLTSHLTKMNSYAKLKDPDSPVDPDTGAQADLPVSGNVGVRLGMVRDYMQQHYDYIMNPASDWATLRALGFQWYLGMNPRSAFVNLTQVPMVTYPWLAQRYGDAASVAAISKAYKDVTMSFRDLSTALEPDVVEAIGKGMEQGFLDESIAVDLAAISDAPGLARMVPVNERGRLFNQLSYWTSFLFHKAEVYNRRVAFVAAYRLARDQGMGEASFQVAKDAVQATQFEYAKWNRAAFMRGKKSVIFLFWNYIQQSTYLAFGGEGPGTALRYWTVLMLAAGLQGLPYSDDLMALYDFLLTKLKELSGVKDPRTSVREDLRHIAGSIGLNPDIAMHGFGRYYGLGPMHLLTAFGVPVANTDISASLGLGRILPGFEDLVGKETDPEKRLARTLVEAGGPVMGIGYNFWRLAFEETPDTYKAVERTLPTAIKNLAKAMRFYGRGGETLSDASMLVAFEDRPTRTAAAAAQALGFGPTVVAQAYEKRFAQREAAMFYMLRRKNLLDDMGWASATNDREGIADVRKRIRDYNREVHLPELRITADELGRSMRERKRRIMLNEMGQAQEKRARRIYHEVGRAYE